MNLDQNEIESVVLEPDRVVVRRTVSRKFNCDDSTV